MQVGATGRRFLTIPLAINRIAQKERERKKKNPNRQPATIRLPPILPGTGPISWKLKCRKFPDEGYPLSISLLLLHTVPLSVSLCQCSIFHIWFLRCSRGFQLGSGCLFLSRIFPSRNSRNYSKANPGVNVEWDACCCATIQLSSSESSVSQLKKSILEYL